MKAIVILSIAVGLVLLALTMGFIQDKLNAVPYNNCPITNKDSNGYTEYQCRNHSYYTR